ncbi:hypothetical protein K439DRAFT_1335031, partial [Ramaria rubella]
ACTKHIQQRYHYIEDNVMASRKATVRYIPMTLSSPYTNIFTKALPREKHWKFLNVMGLWQCSSGSVKK